MKKYLVLSLILIGILVVPSSVFAADISTIATAMLTAATTIGVAVGVIGWIIAGILFATAAGSPDKLSMAKKALIAAIIGSLLVVIAQTQGNITSLIKDAFGV